MICLQIGTHNFFEIFQKSSFSECLAYHLERVFIFYYVVIRLL